MHYNLDVRVIFSSLSMQAILLPSFNLLIFVMYLRYKKNKQAKQRITPRSTFTNCIYRKEINVYNPLESTVPPLLEILLLQNPLFYLVLI